MLRPHNQPNLADAFLDGNFQIFFATLLSIPPHRRYDGSGYERKKTEEKNRTPVISVEKKTGHPLSRLWRGKKQDTRYLGCENGCPIFLRGWDALMFAAERGDLEIVKLLLDHGCKVDASDNATGRTALVCAREAGHLEIANLLQARSTSVDAAPSTAWQKNRAPVNISVEKMGVLFFAIPIFFPIFLFPRNAGWAICDPVFCLQKTAWRIQFKHKSCRETFFWLLNRKCISIK